jgi:hypothetical protein
MLPLRSKMTPMEIGTVKQVRPKLYAVFLREREVLGRKYIPILLVVCSDLGKIAPRVSEERVPTGNGRASHYVGLISRAAT